MVANGSGLPVVGAVKLHPVHNIIPCGLLGLDCFPDNGQ